MLDYAGLLRLNSATKYPSIETYHVQDPKNGMLQEQRNVAFDNYPVTLTEKVDGTNARIIVMPGGDFYIGSREELFHAKGDRVWNNQLSIVNTLYDLAYSGLADDFTGGSIKTYYLEVFGAGIGQGAKNYTTSKHDTDYRLFDVCFVPLTVLDMEREKIASWRDHGGQVWLPEDSLQGLSRQEGIRLTPRLGQVDGSSLPQTVEETSRWLEEYLPKTNVAIDDTGRGRPEGIVIRSNSRLLIAKAKHQDYARTLARRAEQEKAGLT